MFISYTKNDNKKREGTFEGDGYVDDLDCGDGFTGIYLTPNSSSSIH